MPPKDNDYGPWLLELEDGTPVRIGSVLTLTADDIQEGPPLQDIIGCSFTVRGRIRTSRKKLSRRSDWWRLAKTMFGWSYRERRRAIRWAEKKRREAVKCLHGKSLYL